MVTEEDILGIDFGTTNSKMAFLFLDYPEIIKNSEGTVNTPSVVYFADNGEIIVGDKAKRNMVVHPDRTVYSIKRQMGTDFRFNLGAESYPPEYIGAQIFHKLKTDAENELERSIKTVVVSVPANYNDTQRQAIKDAAEISGLNIVRLVNEPTAAALSYNKGDEDDKTLLVYDFGGGTFDVTVLTVSHGFFDIDASGGENKCGGDDMDQRIIDWLVSILKKDYRVDVTSQLAAMQAIKDAAEQAKINLSSSNTVNIDLPFITKDTKGNVISLTEKLTRDHFEEMVKDIILKTLTSIEQTLADAGRNVADIDEILMIGGTSQIPAVRKSVDAFFDQKVTFAEVDPYEAVALGATIASDLTREESARKLKNIDIADVTSHSLGIFVIDEGGTIARILERNTKLPITKTKGPFFNAMGFTDCLSLMVYQGEALYPEDNEYLGELLINVEPKPTNQNKIDVTFSIQEDFGVLDVKAKDRDSGNERSIRMITAGRLDQSEKIKWQLELTKSLPVTFKLFNSNTGDSIILSFNSGTNFRQIKQMLKAKGILISPQQVTRASFYHQDKRIPLNKTLGELDLKDSNIIELRIIFD
ncbi:MAG: Hsp70 family protein [Candidatus Hodarchaeales archaeon]